MVTYYYPTNHAAGKLAVFLEEEKIFSPHIIARPNTRVAHTLLLSAETLSLTVRQSPGVTLATLPWLAVPGTHCFE